MPRKKGARLNPKGPAAKTRRASSIVTPDLRLANSDDESESNSPSEADKPKTRRLTATSAPDDDLPQGVRRTRRRAATLTTESTTRPNLKGRSPGKSPRITSAPSTDRRRKRSGPDENTLDAPAQGNNKRAKRAVSMSDVPQPVKRGPGRPRKYPRPPVVTEVTVASPTQSPDSVAVEDESPVKKGKKNDSDLTPIDDESESSSSSGGDPEDDGTYGDDDKPTKPLNRTPRIIADDDDDEEEAAQAQAAKEEDGNEQGDSEDGGEEEDENDVAENGVEDVIMDDASNLDGGEDAEDADDMELDQDSSGTPKLEQGDPLPQNGEESDAVRTTATAQPGKAIRRLPGRRRAPHPNPIIEAAIRRQLHLRMRFRAVVKGLKPILGELAKRSINELDADAEAHVKNPAHLRVVEQLNRRLEARHALLERQYVIERDHLEQTFEANERAIRESTIHAIAELREQLVHSLQHDMVKAWRQMHVQQNGDLEVTDDEGDGVMPPLRQKVRSRLGAVLGPEYESRSRVMIESTQQHACYTKRAKMLEDQRDWDYESIELPTLPHTSFDATIREAVTIDRRVQLLIKAGETVDKPSHISNSQALGLQLLAGLSEKSASAPGPYEARPLSRVGKVQPRDESVPPAPRRQMTGPTVGVAPKKEYNSERHAHHAAERGGGMLPKRGTFSQSNPGRAMHRSGFPQDIISDDSTSARQTSAQPARNRTGFPDNIISDDNSAQYSREAGLPSSIHTSRQLDQRYSSGADRSRYDAEYARRSSHAMIDSPGRPTQSTHAASSRPQYETYDRSRFHAGQSEQDSRHEAARIQAERQRGLGSSPQVAQAWSQHDQRRAQGFVTQTRPSTEYSQRGSSAASRDYDAYHRRPSVQAARGGYESQRRDYSSSRRPSGPQARHDQSHSRATQASLGSPFEARNPERILGSSTRASPSTRFKTTWEVAASREAESRRTSSRERQGARQDRDSRPTGQPVGASDRYHEWRDREKQERDRVTRPPTAPDSRDRDPHRGGSNAYDALQERYELSEVTRGHQQRWEPPRARY